jgi:hypothetical protein
MELSVSSGKILSLDIDMTQSYVKRIVLISDAKSCSESANSTESYFSISDINLN